MAAAGASQWHHPFLWVVSLRHWVMCVTHPGCQSPTVIPCAAFFFFKHVQVIHKRLWAGFILRKGKKALKWEKLKFIWALLCLLREASVKGPRPCFRNVQPFLDCLLLMLCHRLVHTHKYCPPQLWPCQQRCRGQGEPYGTDLHKHLLHCLGLLPVSQRLYFAFAKAQLCIVLYTFRKCV